MIKKIPFFILGIYLLCLFQTSFLIPFNFRGIVPNLVLISIIVLNIFCSDESQIGIISAFLGGFYLDIFHLSTIRFFGFYALISIICSFFIKFILKKYVQTPVIKRF